MATSLQRGAANTSWDHLVKQPQDIQPGLKNRYWYPCALKRLWESGSPCQRGVLPGSSLPLLLRPWGSESCLHLRLALWVLRSQPETRPWPADPTPTSSGLIREGSRSLIPLPAFPAEEFWPLRGVCLPGVQESREQSMPVIGNPTLTVLSLQLDNQRNHEAAQGLLPDCPNEQQVKTEHSPSHQHDYLPTTTTKLLKA